MGGYTTIPPNRSLSAILELLATMVHYIIYCVLHANGFTLSLNPATNLSGRLSYYSQFIY